MWVGFTCLPGPGLGKVKEGRNSVSPALQGVPLVNGRGQVNLSYVRHLAPEKMDNKK